MHVFHLNIKRTVHCSLFTVHNSPFSLPVEWILRMPWPWHLLFDRVYFNVTSFLPYYSNNCVLIPFFFESSNDLNGIVSELHMQMMKQEMRKYGNIEEHFEYWKPVFHALVYSKWNRFVGLWIQLSDVKR